MNKITQAVILAAGKGTRLHPVTLDRTKAMAPIVGKPIVARVVELFIENGIKDFVLVVSPDDNEIVEYFENTPINADFQFIEQPERRGMADALSRAAHLIASDFLLAACDNLVAEDDIQRMLARWVSKPNLNGVLALMHVPPEKIKSVGIVELDGESISRIIEKPDPAEAPTDIGSMPLYIFAHKILHYLPEIKPSARGEYELQDAIQMLIERDGSVLGFQTQGRMTLTSPADLLALNKHYLQKGSSHAQKLDASIKIIHPVYVEDGAVIGKNSKIGPNAYFEKNSFTGERSVVRESIVLRGGIIPSDSETIHQVIVPNEKG